MSRRSVIDPERIAAERAEHTRKQIHARGAYTVDELIAKLQECRRGDPELGSAIVAIQVERHADGDTWEGCDPLIDVREWCLYFDHSDGSCAGVLLATCAIKTEPAPKAVLPAVVE